MGDATKTRTPLANAADPSYCIFPKSTPTNEKNHDERTVERRLYKVPLPHTVTNSVAARQGSQQQAIFEISNVQLDSEEARTKTIAPR